MAEVPTPVLSVPLSEEEISTEASVGNTPVKHTSFPMNLRQRQFLFIDSVTLGAFGNEAGFPGIDAEIEADALALLSSWDPQVLRVVSNAIAAWASHAPIHKAAVSVFVDAEVENWQDLLLQIWVDASAVDTLQLWSELAATIDNHSRCLTEVQRQFLHREFAVHLLWD